MDELDLAGARELKTLLGVSQQRVYQLTKLRGFPDPVAELAQGRIWLAGEVRTWIVQRRAARGGTRA
ncbi:helix-turn-helix transcriptional regulator [Actinoplanes sp. NPDC051494]|uniref:helix-turn-helix transcriptional regulator n=1 Tax=Actinoplanes sp. NPDC051494 TaxID=3363907 RepID=UPI00378D9A5E